MTTDDYNSQILLPPELRKQYKLENERIVLEAKLYEVREQGAKSIKRGVTLAALYFGAILVIREMWQVNLMLLGFGMFLGLIVEILTTYSRLRAAKKNLRYWMQTIEKATKT